MSTINNPLEKMQKIENELSDRYQQALTDVTCMHLNCGGKFTEDGDFIMDRHSAILYFANNKQKYHYSTPDAI